MKQIVTYNLLFLLLFSCKKDKVPAPCMGVSMTGDRELFVGKWRWYSTTVEEWFDVGPSNYLEYTPQNQGFEYYFTVSNDGLFKAYRNDTLVVSHMLSDVTFENFDQSGASTNAMSIIIDCGKVKLDLRQFTSNITDDSIHTVMYPLNFDDQENHLKSHRNYFVKE